MRRFGAALVALMLAAVGPATAAPAPEPETVVAPCVEPGPACVQWVALGSGGARSMVYATYPLTTRNPRIRRALILVHGTLRNADHYFTTATGAAFLAQALGDTLVIAPAFHSSDKGCEDRLAPGEVSWSCRGDSWRSGGAATSDPQFYAFDFVDTILRKLADKAVFPNLTRAVVAGHSAGGQFVSRYEMSNRVHGTLGIEISYVVANPSSYAWPDASRPLAVGDAAPAAAAAGWNSEKPHTDFRYGPFASSRAPRYDIWPYGLEQRGGGYTAATPDATLQHQLAERPTTYLLSQVDTLPLGGFDDSPAALAQGPTRRARGEAFVAFIAERLGAHPKVLIVPECGHNDRCVYTTDSVLPVIFPRD